MGWSYTVPDVMAINKSNLATHTVEVQHDFSANTNASKYTYYSEPGMIFWCQNIPDLAHYSKDTYAVKFGKSIFISVLYSTYSTTMSPILYDDR